MNERKKYEYVKSLRLAGWLMLQDARNYFSLYPNHSWIEFNIDASIVRNAENKQGSPYDFGVLRTIKDSDIKD